MAYPVPSARIAEIVMFRPMRKTFPWLLYAFYQVSSLLMSTGGAHGTSENAVLSLICSNSVHLGKSSEYYLPK